MKTVHEVNHPIILAETQIIDIDGQSVRTPARVILRLSPRLGLAIESNNLPPSILNKRDLEIELENGARMTVLVGSYKLGKCIEGALVPFIQPCEVINTREPLFSVEFDILNFPEFFGQHDQWSGDRRLGVAKLQAGPWITKITAAPNLDESQKTLKADGGYAVTHTGLITRSDGGTFSVEDAEKFLSGLRAFLSLARGASCGLANVEGKDQHGEQCWLRWGSQHTAPWKSTQSCLTRVDRGDVLTDVFWGFWRLFTKDETWQESILRSIDWYLHSNESAMHVGIILTQASLECLSHQILGPGKRRRRPTGEFIRAALKKLNLDPEIPQSCPKLKTFQQANKWADGPHTFVEIRNALVHSKSKHSPVSLDVMHESRNLGQWYMELILLKLFGYCRHYRNRLSGGVDDVPWARSG